MLRAEGSTLNNIGLLLQIVIYMKSFHIGTHNPYSCVYIKPGSQNVRLNIFLMYSVLKLRDVVG